MRTYIDRARALYDQYGRTDRSGRIYLSGDYIGKIDHAKRIARYRGMTRALILPTTNPADVVAHWLSTEGTR